jgi:signal transduction histidine kinase
MTFRSRLAALMAIGLLLVGTIALVVNVVTYQNSVYQTPDDMQDELLAEMGVSREVAMAYIREHPEVVLNGSDQVGPDGRSVNEVFRQVQRDAQHDAVVRSRVLLGIAIGILAIAAGLIGWLIAGRALKPVRLITARARTASAEDLGARVALDHPPDEIKALADTFDSMLDRLETSFAAQRRFSAQVSHELRTPLAVIRSEADVALADLATGSELRPPLESIRAAALRAERTTATLLALARSESGHLSRQRVDLDELVGEILAEAVEAEQWRDLQVDAELQGARIVGDPALIESLVRNLVDNAARHNRPGGWVRVRVSERGAGPAALAVLEVANSRRPDADPGAAGIGLTLVSAIVEAHDGRLETSVTDAGTVLVAAGLPLAEAPSEAARPAPAAATDDARPDGARPERPRWEPLGMDAAESG